MEQHLEALGDDRFQGDSLALFQLCYQNTKLPLAVRLDAAKAAARFERPVLAQSELEISVHRPSEHWTDDQLRAFITAERAKQGLPAPGGEPLTIDADCVENPLSKSTQ
jgi:hypothetical protein